MQDENKNVILVAYDFTAIGDLAIDHAVQMARILNYKICLLHIINKTSKENLKKQNKPLDSIASNLKDKAESLSKQTQLGVDCIAKEGSIFTSIAEASKEIGANFLIFGTHGKKGIQFLLGSFAVKLIKSCPVPVFVVQKPSEESKYKEIVFPLDLEAGSKQKVKWAIALHKQFGSKFHIFIDKYKDEYAQNKLRADFNQVKKILEKHNISYTENHSPKSKGFDDNCINFAKKINADMLMISTDPDKITWSLFGSPDERIIYNQAKLPVLCINAQDLKVVVGGL